MDRRFYERTYIGVKSSFIIQDEGLGYREFNGTIENISESGILVHVDSAQFSLAVDSIKEGMSLSFQLMDEYELFDETRVDIVNGEVEVVHVKSGTDEKKVGCKIKTLSPEIDEYIQNKRMAIYMKALS